MYSKVYHPSRTQAMVYKPRFVCKRSIPPSSGCGQLNTSQTNLFSTQVFSLASNRRPLILVISRVICLAFCDTLQLQSSTCWHFMALLVLLSEPLTEAPEGSQEVYPRHCFRTTKEQVISTNFLFFVQKLSWDYKNGLNCTRLIAFSTQRQTNGISTDMGPISPNMLLACQI